MRRERAILITFFLIFSVLLITLPTLVHGQPTVLPVIETECPVVPTLCPLLATVCPEAVTVCPVIETECPEAVTECPQVATLCPLLATVCPEEVTVCPENPTICLDTVCPEAPTECPGDYTNCPIRDTVCPELPTDCPTYWTECPLIDTNCPVLETFCAESYTECPPDPTICDYTMCVQVTWCPEVITVCPVEYTFCPESSTLCPEDTTHCPVDSDSDGMVDCYFNEDNCPGHSNGPYEGTCVRELSGVIVSYRVGEPKDFIDCESDDDCLANGGTCQKLQGDYNSNGIGDACEGYADFNGSGGVGADDLIDLKACFGETDFATYPQCQDVDITNDDKVSAWDYGILIIQYGASY